MAFPTITNGGAVNTTNASSHTYASLTGLAADMLVLVAVYSEVASGTPNEPTVTMSPLTFTKVTSQINGIGRLTIFRAMNKTGQTAPTSGNPVVDFGGQTQTTISHSYLKATGIHLSGENGELAVRQVSSSASASSASSGTINIAQPFKNFDGTTVGFFAIRQSGAGVFTPGSGFTTLNQINGSSPNTRLCTEYKNGMDLSVDASWPSAIWQGVALEIRSARSEPYSINNTNSNYIGGVSQYGGSLGVADRKTGNYTRLIKIQPKNKTKAQSVELHYKLGAAGTVNVTSVVYMDDGTGNAPGKLLSYSTSASALTSTVRTTVSRTLGTPSARTLIPGKTYWIGIIQSDPGNVGLDLYVDTSVTTGKMYDFVDDPSNGIENPRVTTGTLTTGVYAMQLLAYTPGFQNATNAGQRRIKLIIDQSKVAGTYTTTMANREVLVKVTHNSLRSHENGGYLTDLSVLYAPHDPNLIPGYLPIRFTRGDTGATLFHSLVNWDKVNGVVTAYVKMPATVPDTFGDMYLTYGDESRTVSAGYDSIATVWPQASYKFVQYMQDVPDTSSGTNEHINKAQWVNGSSFGTMGAGNLVTGKINKAINFDGVDDYIQFAASSNTNFTQNMWIATWVKFDNITASSQGIYYKNHGALRLDYGLMGAGIRSLNLVKYGVIDQHVNVSSVITSTSTWYHIVAVQTATAVTYYVNGVSVGSYANTSAFTAASGNAGIGIGSSGGAYLDGQISSFRMDNASTLTADQIATMYANEDSPETFVVQTGSEETVYDRYFIGGGTTDATYLNAKFAFSSGGDPNAGTPSQMFDTYFDQYSFWKTGETFQNSYMETDNITISGLRYSPIFTGYLVPYGSIVIDTSPGDMTTFEINNVPQKDTVVNIQKEIEEISIAGVGFVSSGSGDAGWRVDLMGNLTTRDRIEIGSMVTYYNNGYTLDTTYFPFTNATGMKFNTVGDKVIISNRPSSDSSPEVYGGSINPAGRDFSQLEIDFDSSTEYGYIELSGRSIKKLTIREDSAVNWWYYEGEGADELIIEPGVTLEGEAYNPDDAAKLYFDDITAVGTALKPITIRFYNNETWSTQERTIFDYDPATTVNFDYLILKNAVVDGGTWPAGDNSLIYYPSSGWTGGSMIVEPATFDNSETITGIDGYDFGMAPDTIAPNTVVTGVHSVSNFNTYVVPDNIPATQFGTLFISHEHRIIEVDTIAPETVVTSPTNTYNETQIIVADTIIDNTTVTAPVAQGELATNDTAPSYDYYARTVRALRDISASVLISFSKEYDPAAGLFVVGTSAFDLGNVWRGNGTAIQEWDKFDYEEYADKLLGFEYHYEQDVLGGMTLGMADITLKNYDDYFSPYGDSPIAANILPGRPIRLYAGYQQLLEQIFVGQSMRLPETTKENARFHAKDFIGSFADTEITDGRIYVNVTTDDVLDDILTTDAGLSSTQYQLDVGSNTMSFLEIKKGSKIGEVIRKLMQAEGGRTYQDYSGEIYFKNRTNKTRPTAITLREGYVFSELEPDESNVINRVKIEADVRTVQASQKVYPALKDGSLTQYEDFQTIEIDAGETVEKFFNFKNPITSITHPVVGTTLTANTLADGTGTNMNGSISYTVLAVFTDSVKYSITNNHVSTTLHVTKLEITGTPATVTEEIRIDVKDQPSIDKYGEQLLEIKNDMFTSKAFALTTANTIVDENKDAPSIREGTIKGLPYLAVGDVVKYYDGEDYVVDIIDGKHSPADGHKQRVRLRKVS